jgi:CO dehydrogenase maturation factor
MKTIAISGKGGTGKSTLSALIIRWLHENGDGPLLAVDADSNVNLNDLLGIDIRETVGSIREEMRESISDLPGGMTKQEFLEFKIHSSLQETPGFDLIAMGRPEGPGCYCYANNLLRDILKTLSGNYRYVVIDNEAGMEHLSRRTTQKIDCLLVVSDPTERGVRAAGKISRLLAELDTRVDRKFLILNRVQEDIPETLLHLIASENLDLAFSVPEDELLRKRDLSGEPIWNVALKSSAYLSVCQGMTALLEDRQEGEKR